jgi:hypothetical protein
MSTNPLALFAPWRFNLSLMCVYQLPVITSARPAFLFARIHLLQVGNPTT